MTKVVCDGSSCVLSQSSVRKSETNKLKCASTVWVTITFSCFMMKECHRVPVRFDMIPWTPMTRWIPQLKTSGRNVRNERNDRNHITWIQRWSHVWNERQEAFAPSEKTLKFNMIFFLFYYQLNQLWKSSRFSVLADHFFLFLKVL